MSQKNQENEKSMNDVHCPNCGKKLLSEEITPKLKFVAWCKDECFTVSAEHSNEQQAQIKCALGILAGMDQHRRMIRVKKAN